MPVVHKFWKIQLQLFCSATIIHITIEENASSTKKHYSKNVQFHCVLFSPNNNSIVIWQLRH